MESASLDSVDVDEIKDLLTCSLCSRTLNEPRILPCFHNFCQVCLGEFRCLKYWHMRNALDGRLYLRAVILSII